jgi:hypothetical protein
MTDLVGNLALELLRAILVDIRTIRDDIREIEHRLTSLEGAVAVLKRDQAGSYADFADQHARDDRLVERVSVRRMPDRAIRHVAAPRIGGTACGVPPYVLCGAVGAG